jgi:hypothetical protein
MLSEDNDELMEKLVTELKDEIINDYTVNKSLQPSLPVFHQFINYLPTKMIFNAMLGK